jgi:hypothetical protein
MGKAYFISMAKIKELESAVSALRQKELKEFRAWFEKFDAQVWDTEFENDVKQGKLDTFANEAISEYKHGKCTQL